MVSSAQAGFPPKSRTRHDCTSRPSSNLSPRPKNQRSLRKACASLISSHRATSTKCDSVDATSGLRRANSGTLFAHVVRSGRILDRKPEGPEALHLVPRLDPPRALAGPQSPLHRPPLLSERREPDVEHLDDLSGGPALAGQRALRPCRRLQRPHHRWHRALRLARIPRSATLHRQHALVLRRRPRLRLQPRAPRASHGPPPRDGGPFPAGRPPPPARDPRAAPHASRTRP